MGWGSGSRIMDGIIDAVEENVKDYDTRYKIYKSVYEVMRDADWDTIDECLGQDEAFDQVASEDGWGNDWEEDE